MLVTTVEDRQSLKKNSQPSMGSILRNGGPNANDITKMMNLIPMDSMKLRAFTALYIQCNCPNRLLLPGKSKRTHIKTLLTHSSSDENRRKFRNSCHNMTSSKRGGMGETPLSSSQKRKTPKITCPNQC